MAAMLDLDAYLDRVGLTGDDTSLATLQRAHVTRIPYENLDVQLGKEVRLDTSSLMDKLVHRRRGGYCFELNTLFGAVLEALGHPVVHLLGRVRLADAQSPRPATHMVLLVDGSVIDVGFGSATPTGPIPLGGEATYGPWTWRTEPIRTPEGETAWAMWFYDMLLYTFTEEPRHAVDFVAPNHFTSTHPLAIFTQLAMVQRWQDDDSQLGLVDLDLTRRRVGLPDEITRVAIDDLGSVLREQFHLDLDDADVDVLRARLRQRTEGTP
jgi:N-hydroxyarylamine O-acetyltransferase